MQGPARPGTGRASQLVNHEPRGPRSSPEPATELEQGWCSWREVPSPAEHAGEPEGYLEDREPRPAEPP